MSNTYYEKISRKFSCSNQNFMKGFSEYDDTKDVVGWVEGWSDLAQLVPKAEALLIFTSYTSSEARKDLHRLQKYCDVKVSITVQFLVTFFNKSYII